MTQKRRGAIPAGEVFGRLTVAAIAGSRSGKRQYRCACACGQTTVVDGGNLRSGRSTSCGCLVRELLAARNFKHGGCVGHPSLTWVSWKAMLDRVTDPKTEGWADYGGRGITVCDRWLSFPSFLADMGPRTSREYSIDRIDNDGNYEPGNCRWATRREQSTNRRNSRRLTLAETTQTLIEWSEISGIDPRTIHHRIACGWDLQDAIFRPAQARKQSPTAITEESGDPA